MTISTNRTSCISQNRSMVFATVVNWFTCNIFPWVLPVVFIFPDSKKTYFYLTNQNSVTVGSSAHFSDRVDCWICSKVKFLQKNSVIHYWRVYLGYLYFKNNDMLYSVCATIFVQISVNKKFYQQFLYFWKLMSHHPVQFSNWTRTYQLGKVFLNYASFVFKLDYFVPKKFIYFFEIRSRGLFVLLTNY